MGEGSHGAWACAQPRPGGCRVLARNPIEPHGAGAGSFVSGAPGSSGSVPSGGPGDAFPMEANSKPGRPSVPEERGAGVPQPHKC